MGNLSRISLVAVIAVIISACSFGTQKAEPTIQVNSLVNVTPVLTLTAQVRNSDEIFNSIDQKINFSFVVTNTGETALQGPVLVNDPKLVITCPDLNSIGNKNDLLETNETIRCDHSYTLTQADLDAGAVSINAIANLGGVTSAMSSVTAVTYKIKTLTLTKTANPLTFNQAGQNITYAYTIKNSGAESLSGQFSISDNKVSVNCTQPTNSQLAPNQEMTCSGIYTITDTDVKAGKVTSTAYALGGGSTSNPASVTINSSTDNQTQNTNPTNTNLVKGTSVQHEIVEGEWLIQIARCYGVDYDAILTANPQITDPRLLQPGAIITIPSIGSAGNLYGPPCVIFHTVKNNETWVSIAAQYNADVAVLQQANPGELSIGQVLKVPKNSAKGN